MNEETKLGYLRDEYLLLQSQYESYDQRSLMIKGWVLAGSAAAISLGFSSGVKNGYPIWFVVAIISACTWYLECKWKMFQYAIRGRIKEIESHFRSEETEIYVFQAYADWFKNYRTDMHLARIAVQSFVLIPYLPIILLCFGAALYEAYWS